MENKTRISFSAITHIGAACTSNDDRIYSNGRFSKTIDADCSRISLEAIDRQFLFALADGMDSGTSGISVTEDLKKVHARFRNSSREIQVKLEELADCVEQANNLLYSVSLGEDIEKPVKPAFAGILIEDGAIAAVNLGSCRIYRLDGDTLKLMVNDYKRTERLLKMGIINDEQAEMLAGQYKSGGADGKASVRKSDIYPLKSGTLYLLCSKGLTEAVSEDTIYDILASGRETDVIADMLVREAIGNESEDNVSVMVLRIEETGAEETMTEKAWSAPARNTQGRIGRLTRNVKRRKLDIAKFVTSLIAFVVIAAFIFGAFTLWLNFRGLNSKDTLGGGSATPTETTLTDEAEPGTEDGDTAGNTLESSAEEIGDDDGSGAGEENAATGSKVPAGGTTYKIKPNDSLMGISEKFYGDKSKYKLIMAANKITNPDKITAGETIIIPPDEP